MCLLDNAETCIVKFLNTLSQKEKKELVPVIFYNSLDKDNVLESLHNILRKHNLFRINRKEKTDTVNANKSQQKETNEQNIVIGNKTGQSNISSKIEIPLIEYDYNGFNEKDKHTFKLLNEGSLFKFLQQENATPSQITEYNELAKKFNANPEGVFKAKDIKRVIALYNLMSKQQKTTAEPMTVFKPLPPLPKNATKKDIKNYEIQYRNWEKLTKDLKTQKP